MSKSSPWSGGCPSYRRTLDKGRAPVRWAELGVVGQALAIALMALTLLTAAVLAWWAVGG